MPFDFAVFNKKNKKLLFLIEFDGPQHRKEKNSIYSKDSRFKIIQKHDNIKTQYCKDNNIPLLRIKTPNEKTIENKILKMLEKFNDYQ